MFEEKERKKERSKKKDLSKEKREATKIELVSFALLGFMAYQPL